MQGAYAQYPGCLWTSRVLDMLHVFPPTESRQFLRVDSIAGSTPGAGDLPATSLPWSLCRGQGSGVHFGAC